MLDILEILGENGEIIPGKEVLQPAFIFNQNNSLIQDVIDIMVPETRKSIDPYEEVVTQLSKLIDNDSPEYVQRTLKSYETFVKTRKGQGELVYKIRDIQDNILDNIGYLTVVDLEKVIEHCEAFTKGQFIIARTLLGHVEEVKMNGWLEKSTSNNKRLIRIL
ncbi:hypothetical protein [Sutcliffiella rhizosphaerae]|uniref:Uncharacterized protein n=1 Tax=Sutcliffiella rhizosphaerae TaxID=2880967 RepID=A0ABN8A8L3_9BACI|nr:hypothetical protein [Sutcliffiella rhizosphaerae]CAG9620267.1 hypothetical protein BACCIP111883_01035 [Sutcliffiella rhizosphaerae]